jgi:hypothetical protein
MVVVFSLHVIISVLFLLDEPMGGWVQKRIFSLKGSEKIKKSLSLDMSLCSGRELVGEREMSLSC